MQAGVLNGEGSDGLSDRAVLLSTFIVVSAEGVQECGFAVVDMAHDRDNWSSQHEGIIALHNAGLDFKFHAHQLDGLVRQDLELVCVHIIRELLRCL